MSDALLENVSALAGQMQDLARQAYAGYAAEVDAVIETRSHDAGHIERLLDGILDFGFDDAMVQLFKRLCRYYYTLDPAATASYVHTYRDMWDREIRGHTNYRDRSFINRLIHAKRWQRDGWGLGQCSDEGV
ncbi:MAG: hypothetical protein A2498_16945 [Lentisphaerae bacterium RIFOXYC12_FULL_60_16]|nr:MAG: hypothetical protein A2498_16945 [Lentisphaerae bacterium RIFOXYC12_FULL_60_16]OGV75422.1 MAG: hypothetical protein A2340_03690 [Lentisphaerae bacterium RIFOXYB12_FULL_60_10]